MKKLFSCKDLTVTFKQSDRIIEALSSVSFTIHAGETVGIVGESGSGKSTLGKALLRLLPAFRGTILFQDIDMKHLKRKELFSFRRCVQPVFQDPSSSLNPRMRIEDAIAEPLIIHDMYDPLQRKEHVLSLLESVGLPLSMAGCLPHELSGGQKQRVCIARALALNPLCIICDEAVSALDVSVRAQILNLLKKLHQSRNVQYLFITHDLLLVRYLAHRVMVMYAGQLMESAPTSVLYSAALHPYTQMLLFSILPLDPLAAKKKLAQFSHAKLTFHPPSPTGCPFASRCPHAFAPCTNVRPRWREAAPHHFVACHLHDPLYRKQNPQDLRPPKSTKS